MNDLEVQLREALRRKEPPEGFADRVMDRIPSGRPRAGWRRNWMAIAAAACLAVVGGTGYEQHRRYAEGERAKQELIYALTVASGSLQMTKDILTR
jgi:hypothetical protein